MPSAHVDELISLIHTDELATALRRSRLAQRHGQDAACTICGQADLRTLVHPDKAAKVRSIVLELHHAGGRHNDSNTLVALCKNCHAIVTEHQRDAGALTDGPAHTFLERLHAWLCSIYTLGAHLLDSLAAFITNLRNTLASLDAHVPAWRQAVNAA